MKEERPCVKCEISFEESALDRCPSCFKLVCENCHYNMRGRLFCTMRCGHYYFFEGEEEDS